MKPSEIRDGLIAEHRSLRTSIDEARLASRRWARGEAPQSHLHNALAELAAALHAHNVHEERALRELSRAIEADGPARQELMDDEHAREHREMSDTLTRIGTLSTPGDSGRELENFCSRVLAHMTREEKGFLNASVLREEAADG